MRSNVSHWLLAGISLFAVPGWCADVATAELRKSKLENLTAAEKDELRRKQERFDRMAPSDQERLREFNEQLNHDPRGEELRALMLRYHSWLRALPSSQRAEIMSLSADARIEKIKQLLAEQENERLKDLAFGSLNRDDINKVRSWTNELFVRVEPELMAAVPPELRRDVEKYEMSYQRFFPVVWAVIRKEKLESDPAKWAKVLKVTEEDRQALVEKLSPAAQAAYKQAQTEADRQKLVENWIKAPYGHDMMRKKLPPDQFPRLLQTADPKRRDSLDYLPRGQMKAKLESLYHQDQFRRFPGELGGFKGRSGPGSSFKKPGEDRKPGEPQKDGCPGEPTAPLREPGAPARPE